MRRGQCGGDFRCQVVELAGRDSIIDPFDHFHCELYGIDMIGSDHSKFLDASRNFVEFDRFLSAVSFYNIHTAPSKSLLKVKRHDLSLADMTPVF